MYSETDYYTAKRIKAEKQFNRQMELNTEVRQLRKEITLLTDKFNKNNI